MINSEEIVLRQEDIKNISEDIYIVPSNITQIDAFAFAGWMYLKKIIIPSSVTKIGGYAFVACINLEVVEMPYSIIASGSVFYDCPNLRFIIINDAKNFEDFKRTKTRFPESVQDKVVSKLWYQTIIKAESQVLEKLNTVFTPGSVFHQTNYRQYMNILVAPEVESRSGNNKYYRAAQVAISKLKLPMTEFELSKYKVSMLRIMEYYNFQAYRDNLATTNYGKSTQVMFAHKTSDNEEDVIERPAKRNKYSA